MFTPATMTVPDADEVEETLPAAGVPVAVGLETVVELMELVVTPATGDAEVEDEDDELDDDELDDDELDDDELEDEDELEAEDELEDEELEEDELDVVVTEDVVELDDEVVDVVVFEYTTIIGGSVDVELTVEVVEIVDVVVDETVELVVEFGGQAVSAHGQIGAPMHACSHWYTQPPSNSVSRLGSSSSAVHSASRQPQ
jgi:hypothetical protein